ncbi:MAG TPA: c-type cytochrome [Panacibacter sp.]|nr:c-type cytochrome [Panacibacter sp.]HNP43384.1 c-type cytochrome [Panacibacter sp.]
MKRLKKIVKWTGINLLILVVVIAAVTGMRQNLHFDAPYPNIKASADSAIIARGRHLVFGAAHCINCHNANNPDSLAALGLDVPLSGAVKFELPVGDIYSKNITPDRETGIGKFTDGEIARVLRYGVHPDGKPVFDFMPFHDMSDEDLTAVISYLRAQKPVYNRVPENDPNIIGNLVIAYLVKPVGPSGPVPASVKKDSTAAYGQYLVNSIAECNGCHTQRDLSGAYVGEPFAGGGKFEEKGVVFYPPNITTDSSSRIFGWQEADFINRFRMGKLIPQSPMPWNAYKTMDDVELKAIYRYLKTIKPAKAPVFDQQLAEK